MTVQTVQQINNQQNISENKNVRTYRDANKKVRTAKKIKPLPPKGHLIENSPKNGVKYFFQDIKYDLKSLKDGFEGNANDHQLGRLNNVGLTIGGIGIATYLAANTPDPKARVMEYVGLAAFLTSMALYPKLAINSPAKAIHGFDVGKKYIDDQGRKKSVFQDSNYIPYDMYRGAIPEEDLDIIGDKMGIPRDIKNRHALIREQMRKTATQNNTLWMLTAGFATPIMTAIMCNLIENYIVEPSLVKSRNANVNLKISGLLKSTQEMESEIPKDNDLSKYANNFLKEFSKDTNKSENLTKFIEKLTEGFDHNLKDGISKDINSILSNKFYIADEKSLIDIIDSAKMNYKGRNFDIVNEAIFPSLTDLKSLLKEIKPNEDVRLNEDEFLLLKQKIQSFIDSKIETTSLNAPKSFLGDKKNDFVNNIKLNSQTEVTECSINKITNFARILGDFKSKREQLDKCKNIKFEFAPETVTAHYYNKFVDTFVKELKISNKDLLRMRDDKAYTEKIVREKLEALVKNDKKYEKAFRKLAKVISKMEESLHGNKEDKSHIFDLVKSIENTYNLTAQRLSDADIGENTIKALVNEPVENLKPLTESLEDFIKLLDGNLGGERGSTVGLGSSKNLEITRLLSRYQGQMGTSNRILHLLDFYKRAGNSEEIIRSLSIQDKDYASKLVELGKNAVLKGTVSDAVTKQNLVNNSIAYKNLFNILYPQGESPEICEPGVMSENSNKAFGKYESLKERFGLYIKRFRNLIANDGKDFTKPYHKFDESILSKYRLSERTHEVLFNLAGQNPIDMVQAKAGKKYADRKWMGSMLKVGITVFGISILSQFLFGRMSNPTLANTAGENNDKHK